MSISFNPEKQYRCTIIRGKAQNEIDDLLPAYAKIITDICPCEKSTFIDLFDKAIVKYLYSPTQKTIANHRTEIAGKLFGMWWEDEKDIVYASKRTERLLESQDNPEFFKDVITKIQFPSGMDKIQTTLDRIKHSIKIRPVSYILKALLLAEEQGFSLTKDEIAYYILNSLEVLQGRIPPEVAVSKIIDRRKRKIFKRVEYPGKQGSYCMQHITELLNIIELANLIRHERTRKAIIVKLNRRELSVISYFAESAMKVPGFDVYSYNLGDSEQRKKLSYDWIKYYASSDDKASMFATSVESLTKAEEKEEPGRIPAPLGVDTTVIGEEGERIVFEREKERVRVFNERLANKVIYFGKQRGLGYDISSIRAVIGPSAEHAIYIEVKSTKRVTRPGNPLKDQFDLTRNEWVAAEQHKDNYFVYRVYITNDGIFVFIMNDPVSLRETGVIYAEPLKYHVEFDEKAGRLQEWKN